MDIDRRTALAALLAAAGLPALDAADAGTQQPEGPDPSLYIPKAHLVDDRAFLHDFMDEYAFVDLVTPAPQYAFPGLKPGDRWCVCAATWRLAYEAGVAPPVVLRATHEETLAVIALEALEAHALDPR